MPRVARICRFRFTFDIERLIILPSRILGLIGTEELAIYLDRQFESDARLHRRAVSYPLTTERMDVCDCTK